MEGNQNEAKKKVNRSKRTLVLQYDMDGNLVGRWPSILKAAIHMNTSRSKIQSCCKGYIDSVEGYVWRYKHPRPVAADNEGASCVPKQAAETPEQTTE